MAERKREGGAEKREAASGAAISTLPCARAAA